MRGATNWNLTTSVFCLHCRVFSICELFATIKKKIMFRMQILISVFLDKVEDLAFLGHIPGGSDGPEWF